MSGGASAAAAAAARKRLEQQEEEVAATNTDPLGGVEFKIIRSATAMFRNPEKFRAVLEEEERAGWELVEKFDNSRVRLRRSIEWRKNDSNLGQDPYRINVGVSDLALGLYIIVGFVAALAMFIATIASVAKPR